MRPCQINCLWKLNLFLLMTCIMWPGLNEILNYAFCIEINEYSWGGLINCCVYCCLFFNNLYVRREIDFAVILWVGHFDSIIFEACGTFRLWWYNIREHLAFLNQVPFYLSVDFSLDVLVIKCSFCMFWITPS